MTLSSRITLTQRRHLSTIVGLLLLASVAATAYLFRDDLSELAGVAPEIHPVLPSVAPGFDTLGVASTTLTQGGKPLVLNGDAAWSLLVVPSEQEAYEYLRTRQAQGFNAILVNLIEHYVGGPRNYNGDLPFVGAQNFARPNPRYFDHADRIFAEAARLGMIVLLAPAYIGYECGEEGWCDEMRDATDQRLRRYAEYVGVRYRNYNNIIWVHGGDADARRFNVAGKVAAVAQGVRRGGGKQLHTAHCARNFSGSTCYADLQLDFDTAYGSCATTMAAIAGMQRRDPYGASIAAPFVYIEGTYENMKETPDCIRDQFLLAMLGGAGGHVFGIQPVWDFGPDWKLSLDSPGSRLITALWQALETLRSGDWIVSAESSPHGAGDFTPLLRNNRLGATLFYSSQARTIEINALAGAMNQRTCWLDLRKLDALSKLEHFDSGNALRHSLTCENKKPDHPPGTPYVSDWLGLSASRVGSALHPWDRFAAEPTKHPQAASGPAP